MEATTKATAMRRELLSWARELMIVVIIAVLIRMFLFTMIYVDGPSMMETLHDGDRLAATIIDMKLGAPNRGDVVICTYPDSDHLCVKRVVGMPGETLEIRDGVTYINGELLEEPYIDYPLRADYPAIEIPADHYFVMGDNRRNSSDSRDSDVGPLAKSAISAKARMILWPLNRMSILEDK